MNQVMMALIRCEVREFFVQRRVLHFIPLLMFGPVAMAWIYPVGSPLAPVIVLTVIGLEPQFNNILFRTPNGLLALGLFPLSWGEVLLAKNVATLVLFFLLMLLLAVILLYFSPEAVTLSDIEQALMYVATIVFPLLHIGNSQSVRRPRKYCGLRLDDLSQALWMCINLAFVSLPYYIMTTLPASGIICGLYVLATCWLWARVSLIHSATLLRHRFPDLCLTK